MKKRDLEDKLRRLGYVLVGGGMHDKWTNAVVSIPVPRHREIAEGTAKAILKQASRGKAKKDEANS